MEQGWNGEKRPSSEAQGRDARNKFRNGRVREMGRKDGHCRGPNHEILPVIPDPTYANSEVQPSTDNRTGYVVDLAVIFTS